MFATDSDISVTQPTTADYASTFLRLMQRPSCRCPLFSLSVFNVNNASDARHHGSATMWIAMMACLWSDVVTAPDDARFFC